jgi:preflagellin peptidase FlaK
MIEVFLLSAAVVGATYASYSDLKIGEIPNRLTLPLIALGLGSYLLYSLYLKNYELLLLVLKNFVLILVIGYLFWLLGGWSAGDAKEFMFLAALVPRYPEFLKPYFGPALAPYPFSLTMLFNTFLAVFPFIALYSILLTYPKVGLRSIAGPLLNYRSHAPKALILLAGYSLALMLGHILFIAPAVLFFAVLRNPKLQVTGALIMIGIYAVTKGAPLFMAKYFLLIYASLAALNFFINLLALLRKEGLRREIRISELEEGMILAEEFYRDGDTVVRDDKGRFERLIESLKDLEFSRRNYLISSSAAGVTKEDIAKLRKLVADGKLEDRVKVTRGMPFAPAILLGFLLSVLAGDLVLLAGGYL